MNCCMFYHLNADKMFNYPYIGQYQLHVQYYVYIRVNARHLISSSLLCNENVVNTYMNVLMLSFKKSIRPEKPIGPW